MELEKPGYNEAKEPTLALCHELGELTPGDLALMEGISPEAASMRLIRYHKWGLLNRTRQGRSYVYTIKAVDAASNTNQIEGSFLVNP